MPPISGKYQFRTHRRKEKRRSLFPWNPSIGCPTAATPPFSPTIPPPLANASTSEDALQDCASSDFSRSPVPRPLPIPCCRLEYVCVATPKDLSRSAQVTATGKTPRPQSHPVPWQEPKATVLGCSALEGAAGQRRQSFIPLSPLIS
jgi:hypothetical protein